MFETPWEVFWDGFWFIEITFLFALLLLFNAKALLKRKRIIR